LHETEKRFGTVFRRRVDGTTPIPSAFGHPGIQIEAAMITSASGGSSNGVGDLVKKAKPR
jgi:hypothetical protein